MKLIKLLLLLTIALVSLAWPCLLAATNANKVQSNEGELLTMIDAGKNGRQPPDRLISITGLHDQMKLMEYNIKRVILKATESTCFQLHKHLASTPDSLNCIGQRGAQTMLKLALSLEETFGPEILSLVLKQ